MSAAQAVLATCVRKRKQMLEKVMAFVMSVLNTANVSPRHKDGAFHMVTSGRDCAFHMVTSGRDGAFTW